MDKTMNRNIETHNKLFIFYYFYYTCTKDFLRMFACHKKHVNKMWRSPRT